MGYPDDVAACREVTGSDDYLAHIRRLDTVISRLRRAVELAYREGFRDGADADNPDEDWEGCAWDISTAKERLTKSPLARNE